MGCLCPEIIQRNLALDNAKLILVFLVVLGHLIEPVLTYKDAPLFLNALYGWIYLFHMPAFVLVSGYLAGKSSAVDFKRSILVPLFSFVILYELLNYILFGSLSDYLFTFMPYWLLWYLLSLYIWRTFLIRFPEPVLLLRIGLCVSLLFGLLGPLGNLFGLARTVYFFPFFVFGYALSVGLLPRFSLRPSKLWLCVFVSLSVSVFVFYYYVFHDVLVSTCTPDLSYYEYCFARFVSLLYGTKGYWHLGVGVLVESVLRIVVYICSFLIAYSFLRAVLEKPFFFTAWGGNTLYVFLWHGMVAKLLLAVGLFHALLEFDGFVALAVMFSLSVFLTWLLSCKEVAAWTDRYVFAPVWFSACALWNRYVLFK